MKKIAILSFLISSALSFGQNQNTVLYKVYGNGVEQPSYIFGTIHISCEAKIDSAMKLALDATTQLYLEVDLDDPEMQSKMMQEMAMKNNVKISTLLSPEDYTIVDNYLKSKMGVPAAAFDTYKPFILISMFIPTLLECAPQSIESELLRYVTEQKEATFGLETVEEQMRVFDEIPYQLQIEELLTSIKSNFKSDKAELNALLNSYAKKDLNEMQKIMDNSSSLMNKEFGNLLLKDRNERWIPKIERAMKEQPTFFGVGAAHLLGSDGVITLLRNKGYTVDPM